ncbi:MAG TPA: efflux RND transporter permease subunit [Caulobacteraceae bacterium]|jgi:multidrug efflux pump|nr:efflux RND transporter permease subunit [Caulobacteraceae bacterium]
MSFIGALVGGAIKRRLVVIIVTLIASGFGVFAYLNLPRESQPDVTVPYIVVTVPFPGVSPEDSERLLVRPLETQFKSLEGLKEMNAAAIPGAAVVVLEFEVNFDKEKTLNDVRAKVDQARSRFPPDALPPTIQEQNVDQNPVLTVILSGKAPERALYQASRRLADRLESVPGVIDANLYGARDEQLEVTIDPVKLESYNVTVNDLARIINSNNQLIPAGDLQTKQGDFAVKVPGVVVGPQDVLALPIKTNGDKVVTLGDIGDVRRTFKESTTTTRIDGERAFTVEVIKRPGANILDTVKNARAAVQEEQARFPSTIKVQYQDDESEFINRTLNLLESGLIMAVILVMVIVVASLGIRAGLLVGAAIPCCFMLAFLLLQATHITLNQMVMFGLVLAVGMLVDGSIVVVEYADRKMAEGHDKKEAYRLAGERMFWPVFNGIATTLCAFLPFLFWNSIAGKFMSFLPITLFFVLASSIFIALIFTPALGSVFGKRNDEHDHSSEQIDISEHGDPRQMKGFMGAYARFVAGAIRRPVAVLGAGLVVIAGITGWFVTAQMGLFGQQPHRIEFFLDEDPDNVSVYVQARGNLSVPAQDALVSQVERKLVGIKGVNTMYVRVGRTNSLGFGGPPQDSIGRINLQFLKYEQLKALGLTGNDIVAAVRKRVGETPGLGVEVRPPQNGPTPGKDIQIELRGADNASLNKAADQVLAHLHQDNRLIDLEDSRTSPGMEWDVAVDREAAGRYGVSVLEVGQAIQFATDGILVGRFRPDDAQDELDIRVRFPDGQRSLNALDTLKITTPNGPVPASYFVTRTAAPQVDSIKRRDSQRLALIQANARPGVAANLVIGELKPWLAKMPMDSTVHWKFRGGDEETQNAGAFFMVAMAVSLFLMGMILLWQFNSLWGMFATLFAVVLSTMGVLLGIQVNLLGTFNYISVIMCGTGVVALAGVIVGHNIVLVDTYYQIRRNQGLDRPTAALKAAVQRFRPVLLTTLTAVIGLLPLMFQIEPSFRTGRIEYKPPGSEWWVQMASAIVWGLSFSTMLTLLLTPVMLAVPDPLIRLLRRLFGIQKPAKAQGPWDHPAPHPAE